VVLVVELAGGIWALWLLVCERTKAVDLQPKLSRHA
jgi:hypothetical protein